MQSHFAAKTQAENLTVRELERLTIDTLKPESDSRNAPKSAIGKDLSELDIPKTKSSRGTRLPSAEVQELERKLREHFGTRVTIEESLRKGRILIEFFSTDDLQRIVNILKMDD